MDFKHFAEKQSKMYRFSINCNQFSKSQINFEKIEIYLHFDVFFNELLKISICLMFMKKYDLIAIQIKGNNFLCWAPIVVCLNHSTRAIQREKRKEWAILSVNQLSMSIQTEQYFIALFNAR